MAMDMEDDLLVIEMDAANRVDARRVGHPAAIVPGFTWAVPAARRSVGGELAEADRPVTMTA
jgi:hypothetical protein